jgi:hypothetical protein
VLRGSLERVARSDPRFADFEQVLMMHINI